MSERDEWKCANCESINPALYIRCPACDTPTQADGQEDAPPSPLVAIRKQQADLSRQHHQLRGGIELWENKHARQRVEMQAAAHQTWNRHSKALAAFIETTAGSAAKPIELMYAAFIEGFYHGAHYAESKPKHP